MLSQLITTTGAAILDKVQIFLMRRNECCIDLYIIPEDVTRIDKLKGLEPKPVFIMFFNQDSPYGKKLGRKLKIDWEEFQQSTMEAEKMYSIALATMVPEESIVQGAKFFNKFLGLTTTIHSVTDTTITFTAIYEDGSKYPGSEVSLTGFIADVKKGAQVRIK